MAVPIRSPAKDVVAPDPIEDALARALDAWSDERDERGLRRALLGVLARLDELP
jgi:hypothetical protein